MVDNYEKKWLKTHIEVVQLYNLITKGLDLHNDFDYTHKDYKDTLENFLIGRSMLEHPSNFGAGGLKMKDKRCTCWRQSNTNYGE